MPYKDPLKQKEYFEQYRLKNRDKNKEYFKKYALNHWEQKLNTSKKYRNKNKEKAKEYREAHKNERRQYDLINIVKQKEQRHEYYLKNKERIYNFQKEYRKKNKEKINIYENNRYKNDLEFKIKKICRSRLNSALNGDIKANKTIPYLGCTINELKNHLEKQFKPGMSWKNWALNGWHIDHIIPCDAFDFTNPEDQKKCFHYTNLQPLWAEENLKKSNKIIEKEESVDTFKRLSTQ